MNRIRRHSALAWVLIVTQLAFCVIGHGRVVVCHDEGGPSHIELVHGTAPSPPTQSSCGQLSGEQGVFEYSLCTGVPCVDEVISFTFTTNTRRSLVDFSTDLIYTTPPLLAIYDVLPRGPQRVLVQSTEHETACYLQELQSSIRTSVLVV